MMTGNKKKLKKAPHLDNQDKSPKAEIIALIGSKAWNAWEKGKGLEWDLLRQNLNIEKGGKPLILGSTQLSELSQLRLAEENHRIIRLCQFGELTEPQKTALSLNLAINSQVDNVFLCDNLGQKIEDISHYINKLRADQEAQQIAQQVAELAEVAQAPKTSPYIEYRENGKIKGLHYVVPKVDKESFEILGEKTSWICDDLALVGEGKTSTGEYYYLFQWQNSDEKNTRVVAIAREEFGTEAGWKILKAQGLKMTQGAGLTQKLTEHFHFNGDHSTQWTVTKTTGWTNGAYLMPNGDIIGQPSKPIYFTDKSGASTGYSTKGTLDDWQREIAQNLKGNNSMMLGVAVALSAPLLALLGCDSFGVHLFAESSKGKTTILNIANSLYGDPNKIKLSWSATAVGVKNEATARNDGLITLDEIGQAKDVKNLEAIAYDLFNETGKLQGKKEGGNREINRWKVTALSTGEKDLETQLALQGAKVHAGQLVRLINIPLEEVKHHHQFSDIKAHADHLNESSKAFYGTIGREWIAFLSENKEKAQASYKEIRQKWLELTENMSGQVQRVAADRFAILETALHLASHLTQWSEEDNQQAILKNFLNWKEDFGEKSREENNLISDFLDWLSINESSFLEYPHRPEAKAPPRMLGVRVLKDEATGEGGYYFVIPKIFREATIGYPKNMALKILTDAGIMHKPPNLEKNYDYQFKIPSKFTGQRIRAYKITPIIEDEETH